MTVKTPTGFNALGRYWQGRDGSGRRQFSGGADPGGADPGDTDSGNPGDPADPGTFGIQSVTFPDGFVEGGRFIITGDVFGATGPTLIAAFQPLPSVHSAGSTLTNATVINNTQFRGNSTKTLVADIAPFDGRLAMEHAGANIEFYKTADDSVRSALGISASLWHGCMPFREFKNFNVKRDPDYFPNYDYNQLVIPQIGTDANGFSLSPSSTKDSWVMYGPRGDNNGTDGMGHDIICAAHPGTRGYAVGGNNTRNRYFSHLDSETRALDLNWSYQKHNMDIASFKLPGGLTGQYNSACYGGCPIAEYVHTSADRVTKVTDWSGQDFMQETVNPNTGTKCPDWWDRVKFGGWLRSERDRRYSYLYHAISDPIAGTHAMCSVEISNGNGSYNSATKRMVCPITSWSNTQVEGILWLGGLKAGQEAIYMCVCNKDNIRCANFQVR